MFYLVILTLLPLNFNIWHKHGQILVIIPTGTEVSQSLGGLNMISSTIEQL